jgi:hypothetical protein
LRYFLKLKSLRDSATATPVGTRTSPEAIPPTTPATAFGAWNVASAVRAAPAKIKPTIPRTALIGCCVKASERDSITPSEEGPFGVGIGIGVELIIHQKYKKYRRLYNNFKCLKIVFLNSTESSF